jgi:hypothetical protein
MAGQLGSSRRAKVLISITPDRHRTIAMSFHYSPTINGLKHFEEWKLPII